MNRGGVDSVGGIQRPLWGQVGYRLEERLEAGVRQDTGVRIQEGCRGWRRGWHRKDRAWEPISWMKGLRMQPLW